MPRLHQVQTAFNAGVMDPRTNARHDLRQYYQGLSKGNNILTRPMGGIRRRPGMRYVGTLPGLLTAIHASATAPNGGTAANAQDDDRATLLTTTTDIDVLDPYVVVHYDLGAAAAVKFADVLDITSTGGNTDEFQIQYSTDDATWSDLGARFERVDQEARDFRRAGPVTARYWRVAKIGGSGMGAEHVSLAEFSLYAEGAYSDGQLFSFEFSIAERYAIAATDRNLAIIQGDEIVANVPAPWAEVELEQIDAAQSADTMILVHPDHPPQRLVRGREGVGAIFEDDVFEDGLFGPPTASLWRLEPVPFSQIPQLDFNDADSPAPVSEVQRVGFAGSAAWEQGDTFTLELGGTLTRTITYSGSTTAEQQASTAENIRRELQKLPVIGFSGISVAWVSTLEGPLGIFFHDYEITFAGASADALDLLGGIPQSGASSNLITVNRIAAGSSRSEDAWSTLRGWPRSVTFFDGRLFFGGSRSLPQTVFGSTITDVFSFEVGEGFDDEAIIQTVNSDKLNTIQRIFAGRELQLFTTGGEARYLESILTPENAYPKFQTRYGSAAIKPVSIDGATLFVQRTGKVIREFVFAQDEEAYLSPPVTALAPFLINNVSSMAGWQGSGDDDANYVFVVNGDGTVAVFNTLRSQEIASWVRWTTAGLFKSVTTVVEDIYFLVRREIDGVTRLFVELVDESRFTDAAALGAGAALAVEHLAGRTVQILADGYVLDDQEVIDGNVTLHPAVMAAEAGLGFAVECATMPLNGEYGNGMTFLRKKRLVKARLYVHETGSIIFNGKRYYDRQYDVDALDQPPRTITGMIEIGTTSNWTEGPLILEFGQDTPGPFEILGMDLQVEVE